MIDPRMQEDMLMMRKLTRNLMGCSDTLIVDGDERKFTDSGEHLQKGKPKFV
jgi:hypothetical protein